MCFVCALKFLCVACIFRCCLVYFINNFVLNVYSMLLNDWKHWISYCIVNLSWKQYLTIIALRLNVNSFFFSICAYFLYANWLHAFALYFWNYNLELAKVPLEWKDDNDTDDDQLQLRHNALWRRMLLLLYWNTVKLR